MRNIGHPNFDSHDLGVVGFARSKVIYLQYCTQYWVFKNLQDQEMV